MLDNGLGPWLSMFIYNLYMQFLSKMSYFLFRFVTEKWIGDYFEIRRYAQNFGASIYLRVITMKTCFAHKLNHGEIIAAPLYWRTKAFLRQIWTRFELVDFFLVRAASLFTLRTVGAQINWRIISSKVLFDPHRFLSNKSPIPFPGENGKGNTFLNGKRHVQNENGHRSPQSQT